MTPLARLFYVSLWCESDREGRLEWKPGTFKARYLPADDCDINVLGDELVARGLIVLYATAGKTYAEIPTFTEHQVINNREGPSKIPQRDDNATFTRESGVKAEGKEGRKGKEGKEGTCPAQEPDAPHCIDSVEIPKKPKRRSSTEEDMTAARWMFGLVKTVNATAKDPNFDVWADEVRLMREIDGRTHAEICAQFQWAKRDSFWCANVQSPAKLREKWDQLTEQRSRPIGAKTGQPNPKFNFADADRSGDAAAMAASMRRHNITVGDDHVDI